MSKRSFYEYDDRNLLVVSGVPSNKNNNEPAKKPKLDVVPVTPIEPSTAITSDAPLISTPSTTRLTQVKPGSFLGHKTSPIVINLKKTIPGPIQPEPPGTSPPKSKSAAEPMLCATGSTSQVQPNVELTTAEKNLIVSDSTLNSKDQIISASNQCVINSNLNATALPPADTGLVHSDQSVNFTSVPMQPSNYAVYNMPAPLHYNYSYQPGTPTRDEPIYNYVTPVHPVVQYNYTPYCDIQICGVCPNEICRHYGVPTSINNMLPLPSMPSNNIGTGPECTKNSEKEFNIEERWAEFLKSSRRRKKPVKINLLRKTTKQHKSKDSQDTKKSDTVTNQATQKADNIIVEQNTTPMSSKDSNIKGDQSLNTYENKWENSSPLQKDKIKSNHFDIESELSHKAESPNITYTPPNPPIQNKPEKDTMTKNIIDNIKKCPSLIEDFSNKILNNLEFKNKIVGLIKNKGIINKRSCSSDEEEDKKRKNKRQKPKRRKYRYSSSSEELSDWEYKKTKKSKREPGQEVKNKYNIVPKRTKQNIKEDKIKSRKKSDKEPIKSKIKSKVKKIEARSPSPCCSYKKAPKKTNKETKDEASKELVVHRNLNEDKKLSRQNLNQYFSQIRVRDKLFENISRIKENITVTVPNDNKKTLNLNDPASDEKDRKSEKGKPKKHKKFKLVINVVCDSSNSNSSDGEEDKETVFHEDLSFLDDINIEEIIEGLAHEKKHNNEPANVADDNNVIVLITDDEDSDASTVHLEDLRDIKGDCAEIDDILEIKTEATHEVLEIKTERQNDVDSMIIDNIRSAENTNSNEIIENTALYSPTFNDEPMIPSSEIKKEITDDPQPNNTKDTIVVDNSKITNETSETTVFWHNIKQEKESDTGSSAKKYSAIEESSELTSKTIEFSKEKSDVSLFQPIKLSEASILKCNTETVEAINKNNSGSDVSEPSEIKTETEEVSDNIENSNNSINTQLDETKYSQNTVHEEDNMVSQFNDATQPKEMETETELSKPIDAEEIFENDVLEISTEDDRDFLIDNEESDKKYNIPTENSKHESESKDTITSEKTTTATLQDNGSLQPGVAKLAEDQCTGIKSYRELLTHTDTTVMNNKTIAISLEADSDISEINEASSVKDDIEGQMSNNKKESKDVEDSVTELLNNIKRGLVNKELEGHKCESVIEETLKEPYVLNDIKHGQVLFDSKLQKETTADTKTEQPVKPIDTQKIKQNKTVSKNIINKTGTEGIKSRSHSSIRSSPSSTEKLKPNVVKNLEQGEKYWIKQLENRMYSYLKRTYSVTDIIHRGKFSNIFQCVDTQGWHYAVKVLSMKCDRFYMGTRKEDMIVAMQKDIPKENLHFVYIRDGFSLGARWCFLMDYYPKNLEKELQQNGPFHIDLVQHLSRQLVAAVTVLRNNNVVHTDIKPSHILLNYSNKMLKLCGFDEAQYYECLPIRPNYGTVNYRAPEIILGYPAGYNMDVWSTALVMFEMATGRQLLPGQSNNEILYKQQCTIGTIPLNMLQQCSFLHKHFKGVFFMKKRQQGVVYIRYNQFYRNKILHSSIKAAYKKRIAVPNIAMHLKLAEMNKVDQFINLLEQMLAIDPQNRISIEFAFANPFLFQTG